ncbi:single-stranded DNA-binding protein [Bacillus sp. HMF5848]|uniref:single-stranded DNA-binding protein n=1 Tax=Bacillus sp. HMF5848 TaxID=2495421 RepID=UPI000F7BA7B7|nr:single-stranded DNA-binding protein [Bacillus sp. HMF5848]RSK28883.1 single-stranded DNA-binding protein [Bacillus sp. HMF5848]
MNNVVLVGRLTRDPELKYLGSGVAVSHVTIAINRNFRNANGQIDADFVNCTIWRKSAENIANYCRKGSVVGVTGRLQSRSYDKDGRRIYVTEVVADHVQFLSKRPPTTSVPQTILNTNETEEAPTTQNETTEQTENSLEEAVPF